MLLGVGGLRMDCLYLDIEVVAQPVRDEIDLAFAWQ
jgi:hypothetical protein